MITKRDDGFDVFDAGVWRVSDHTIRAGWIDTSWDADHVVLTPGEVVLQLDGTDRSGKQFSGAEVQSDNGFGYGSFTVEMRASGESGVVSSFFLYTGDIFGADRHNEIDIEFLGNDTTVMHVNSYYGDSKLADVTNTQVALGFDAAAAMHTYRIDWMPDAIRWFVDGDLAYEQRADLAPIPDEAMKLHFSVWTGDDALENWHGPVSQTVDTQATYGRVAFAAAPIGVPVDVTGAADFSNQERAVVVNMGAGRYAEAARVLPAGDSLTVGIVDAGDPNERDADRAGWRNDLFDNLVGVGGWIDYVGPARNGPDGMQDRDHGAVSGISLREIVNSNGSAGAADLSDNLASHAPDVVLLMAGTNDYNSDREQFFSRKFDKVMSNMDEAIDQFYAARGSDGAWLVVSTLAPKIRGGIPAEFAEILNEGYSIVSGDEVVGDAGNATWRPGLRALIEGRQAEHPTLLLFENPLDETDLSPDEVHFTNEAYTRYANDLSAFLQAEIGLSDGTLGGVGRTFGPTDRVVGSAFGDRIVGGTGDDVIDGGGGGDYLEGGGGRDVFRFGANALDGALTVVADFSVAQGDGIDLSGLASALGLTPPQMLASLTITDGDSGAWLTATGPNGPVTFARIDGVSAADLEPRIDATPLPSADDDGNLRMSTPDAVIGADETDAVVVAVSGLDADATAVISISDGVTVVTRPAMADGPVTFDVSGLREGALTTTITATAGDGATLTRPGPSLSLTSGRASSGSADADGNMALSAPDVSIDATEAGAVVLSVSGLDADATGVVSVSDGTRAVTSGAVTADGDVVLDLSGLAEGALTSVVTATDVDGDVARVSGPGLVLDLSDGGDGGSGGDGSGDGSGGDGSGGDGSGGGSDGGGDTGGDTGGGRPATAEALTGTAGDDKLRAGGADTTLEGLDGRDRLLGGDGADVLLGGAGRDQLRGGGGDDWLEGGAEGDVLVGGAGADRFVFGPGDGRDRIDDFSSAEGDVLDVSALVAAFGWSEAEAADNVVLRQSGGDVVFQLAGPNDGANVAILKGITTADVDTGDILF